MWGYVVLGFDMVFENVVGVLYKLNFIGMNLKSIKELFFFSLKLVFWFDGGLSWY